MQDGHYKIAQQLIRHELHSLLRRTRGLTDESQWTELVDDPRERRRLMLHLCQQLPDGVWEWKPEVANVKLLLKRTPAAAKLGLDKLYESSQSRRRCSFPHLTASNKPHLFRALGLVEPHVFGYDILIRPLPARGFASECGQAEHDLQLASLAICFIIHCDIDTRPGVASGFDASRGFCRAVCGDELHATGVVDNAVPLLTVNEYKFRELLQVQQWGALTTHLTTIANRAAARAVLD